jgi:SPP1 gp7 family putative phage head morphogenesis protein
LVALEQGDSFVKATATVPIEAAAFAARDAVDRLKKHDQTFREEASTIITQGLIQGQGAQKVAGFLRQRLGVTKGKAETIARTEIISAQDSATRSRYKEYGIQYSPRIATQDRRVCNFCADRAGNVYPVDAAPAVIHPQDRCYSLHISLNKKRLTLSERVDQATRSKS